MVLLPHIDISEPERIQALLADERNFCWRAVDSEGLDGWMPDIGLTGYPRPSVFRSAAVARGDQPSVLKHRFWQTVQSQADHTGPRYIGIVIYLVAGEASPLALRLRGEDIGRIEPRRCDNRVHLLVVDKPVEFIGEMEIFNLIAPGAGAYRVEHILLLHERPAPSSFVPEIQNLTLRLESGSADLHFTTSHAAAVEARVMDAAGEMAAHLTAAPSRLHHLVIADLDEGGAYTVEVSARDGFGASSQESLRFDTRPAEKTAASALEVPLEMMNLGTADLSGMPLSFGVPLAEGGAYEIDSCSLRAGGRMLPADARALARWPDGSIRWALVESRVPSEMAGGSSLSASAQINGEQGAAALGGHQTDISLSGGVPEIRAGDGRVLSLADLRFEAVLGNGMTLRASAIHAVERPSERQLSFAVDHEDARGVAHLRSRFRLRSYGGQSFVKLHHRLEVISPALAPAAAGGGIPAECADEMRANIVGESGEESTLLKLRSFALRVPIAGAESVRHAGETWKLRQGEWKLRHDHDLGHEIGGERREGRAKGHIRAEGDAGSLGICLRNFWQTYPKALSVDAAGVDIGLFPDRRGVELPGDDDASHRLYFWLDDEGYKLKAGMALSSEILLDFAGEASAAFDWLEQGIVVRPDIEYLNATGALNPIGARKDSILPNYEGLADLALQSFHEDREHFRAYGQVNFGDWYGESGWSWGNNEYDPAYVGYSEFLRGGEPGWAAWAAESARHLADVDTINFSSDRSEIGGQAMHMPGHLGGYLPPYFRSKMGGTKAGPAHMWVEGPLLHYVLTGDELVFESLMKTRDWLTQARLLDYYDYTSARDSGWHLIHLSMLALVLDDPVCLNAAGIIVERVLERRTPGGGWDRMLGEPHCGCGYPRCSGEAGFMICVLISGLKRYHHLTGDEQVAGAIIGGARWLINETYDAASGQFRYTSCEKRSLGGTFQYTQWVMEALAAAWELSGDAEIGDYLRRGLAVIGQYPARVGHLGIGKAMSQQMRYVPTILASLAGQSLQNDDD